MTSSFFRRKGLFSSEPNASQKRTRSQGKKSIPTAAAGLDSEGNLRLMDFLFVGVFVLVHEQGGRCKLF